MTDQKARTPRPPATGDSSARAPTARASGGDELPYVDDPVSRLWVLVIIAVFGAIFLYAVLLGRGGLLSPQPTPSPSPTPTPIVSPSPSPSPTPAGSPTPTVTPSPSPGGSPSPSPTAAPTG